MISFIELSFSLYLSPCIIYCRTLSERQIYIRPISPINLVRYRHGNVLCTPDFCPICRLFVWGVPNVRLIVLPTPPHVCCVSTPPPCHTLHVCGARERPSEVCLCVGHEGEFPFCGGDVSVISHYLFNRNY